MGSDPKVGSITGGSLLMHGFRHPWNPLGPGLGGQVQWNIGILGAQEEEVRGT